MDYKINNIVHQLTDYSHINKPSETDVLKMNTLCSQLITEINRVVSDKTNHNSKALEELDQNIDEAVRAVQDVQRRRSFQIVESGFDTDVQQDHVRALKNLQDRVSTLRVKHFSN